MAKTIHLTCGHNIKVRTWPSKLGLAKVRHHYKKFHPTRMKKMIRKSLATKKKRGLINSLDKYFSYLNDISQDVQDISKKGFLDTALASHLKGHFKISSDEARRIVTTWRRGLIRNRCNPKIEIPRKRCPYCKKYSPSYLFDSHVKQCRTERGIISRIGPKHNPPQTIIYDKLLGIEARKSHGKFKGQNFFHDFKKNTDAMVVGNPDGSLTIKSSKGKRLWKKFKY